MSYIGTKRDLMARKKPPKPKPDCDLLCIKKCSVIKIGVQNRYYIFPREAVVFPLYSARHHLTCPHLSHVLTICFFQFSNACGICTVYWIFKKL